MRFRTIERRQVLRMVRRWERRGWCKLCGVYLITNNLNGKRYVGSSVDIGNRVNQHFGVAMRKYKDINPMYAEIAKYGRENFTVDILETCSREDKLECERKWFKKLHPEYNQVLPDECPFKHEAVRKKSYESCHTVKGTQNRINAHTSDEYRAKMRNLYLSSGRSVSCRGVKGGEYTEVFTTMTDAAKWLNVNSKLCSVVGKIKRSIDSNGRVRAYGYVWERV